jgi:hypothetical protein
MFVRFMILGASGSIKGKQPLKEIRNFNINQIPHWGKRYEKYKTY